MQAQGITTVTPLRHDITFYQGTTGEDGMPTYVLHDRWRNQFFNIGWLEFELLKRWRLRDPEKIIQSVINQTTLYASKDDVEAFQRYLDNNDLLSRLSNSKAVEGVIKQLRKKAEHKLRRKQGLQSLLPKMMWRIPLLKPDKFLTATLWIAKPFMTRTALYVFVSLFILAAVLVAQQWHEYKLYFRDALSFQGFIFIFLSLTVSKSLHELGHAYVTKRYGLTVHTMGVFVMVIFPFLYTDTTESWKLSSRKQRMAIAVAGVSVEFGLAIICTILWAVFPAGGIRSACFYLATAAWFATLMINLSPFMRWDGYWVLSDFVGIQNLHERSAKLAKWFFGKMIMGFGEPAPLTMSRKKRVFCICFAVMAWIYRIGIFLGIGLLMFAKLFKVLGILMVTMFVMRMVIMPIVTSLRDWVKRRQEFVLNRYSIFSWSLILGFVGLLVIPWNTNISAHALLTPRNHIEVYPGVEGEVQTLVKRGTQVEQGAKLYQMANVDLEHKKRVALNGINYYAKVLRQVGSDKVLQSRDANRQLLIEAESSYKKTLRELSKLQGYAPFAGRVIWTNSEVQVGNWVSLKTPLLTVADTGTNEIYGFVNEYNIQLLEAGSEVIFYPDHPYFEPVKGVLKSIDEANLTSLDYPFMSARYNGPIKVDLNAETGQLEPSAAIYLARVEILGNPERFAMVLKGQAVFQGKKQSLITRFYDGLVSTIIRETGF